MLRKARPDDGPLWPARRVGPLRLALAHLAFACAALVGGLIALFAAGDPEIFGLMVLFALAGAAYIAAGVFAWARRPGNGTGALLVLGGFSLLAPASANTGLAPFTFLGQFARELPLAVIFHLLLAVPSGRTTDRTTRRIVVAGYLVSIVPNALIVLLSGDPAVPEPLRLVADPDVARIVTSGRSLIALVVIALGARVLFRKVRTAEPSTRRGISLLCAYGAATFAFLLLAANVLRPLLGLDPRQLFLVQIVALAGIPVAFAAGVLRGGFARTRGLDELAARLAVTDAQAGTLQDALRMTLGDPSVELLFWLGEAGHYVDERGVFTVPPDGGARGTAVVDTPSGRIGAIVYDRLLIADPEPVQRAAGIIGLALERERLTAELRASQEGLRESRSRLVEYGEQERRRLARDLHDGLQGRLVVLALRAGQLASRLGPDHEAVDELAALRADVDASIVQLRRLVHGVLPDLLEQRGLPAAIEELLDNVPMRTRLHVQGGMRRLPPSVESAGYFAVAEAVANATKHAGANEVQVVITLAPTGVHIEVRDDGIGGVALDHPDTSGSGSSAGSGLRGLIDRVEALGGRLHVHSPSGQGTLVSVELPCAS